MVQQDARQLTPNVAASARWVVLGAGFSVGWPWRYQVTRPMRNTSHGFYRPRLILTPYGTKVRHLPRLGESENWLSNRVFKSYDDLVDHCCAAWNRLVDQPWRIMSIGLRQWAHGFFRIFRRPPATPSGQ